MPHLTARLFDSSRQTAFLTVPDSLPSLQTGSYPESFGSSPGAVVSVFHFSALVRPFLRLPFVCGSDQSIPCSVACRYHSMAWARTVLTPWPYGRFSSGCFSRYQKSLPFWYHSSTKISLSSLSRSWALKCHSQALTGSCLTPLPNR